MASINVTLPDPLVERLEEIRRAAKGRIPRMSEVVRSLIEDGFAHRASKAPAEAAE